MSCYAGASTIRSKPKEILEAISRILSTSRPDEAISGELADVVGFEDIELVAGLLTSRSYFMNSVSSDQMHRIQLLTLPSCLDGTGR